MPLQLCVVMWVISTMICFMIRRLSECNIFQAKTSYSSSPDDFLQDTRWQCNMTMVLWQDWCSQQGWCCWSISFIILTSCTDITVYFPTTYSITFVSTYAFQPYHGHHQCLMVILQHYTSYHKLKSAMDIVIYIESIDMLELILHNN
jgi:hypothetical protein